MPMIQANAYHSMQQHQHQLLGLQCQLYNVVHRCTSSTIVYGSIHGALEHLFSAPVGLLASHGGKDGVKLIESHPAVLAAQGSHGDKCNMQREQCSYFVDLGTEPLGLLSHVASVMQGVHVMGCRCHSCSAESARFRRLQCLASALDVPELRATRLCSSFNPLRLYGLQ